MRLLHAGLDTSVIALWLGHEQAETTQIYHRFQALLSPDRWHVLRRR
jgi:site-specific recombinase XerD